MRSSSGSSRATCPVWSSPGLRTNRPPDGQRPSRCNPRRHEAHRGSPIRSATTPVAKPCRNSDPSPVPWPASRAPSPVEPGRPRAAAWLSPAGGGGDLPDNPGFDVLAVVHVVEGSGGGAGVLARLGPAVQHGTRHRCPLGSPSRSGISVTSSSGLIVVICTAMRPLQRNTRAEAVAHPAGVSAQQHPPRPFGHTRTPPITVPPDGRDSAALPGRSPLTTSGPAPDRVPG